MSNDKRHITDGRVIPSHFYADQPYIVKTADGAWLNVLTTGEGREGASGQFVITQRSTDQGSTWIDETRMEQMGAPENSWGVLLKAPSGRVFCFYIFNADDLRKIPADPGSPAYPDGFCYRVDSVGEYAFRYSDDHGKTWSEKRYSVPVREFEIDRNNPTGGEVRYFWNVGRPFVDDSIAYIPLHKVGGFGAGFFTSSEGSLAASSDLLSVEDPGDASWETLPEGDKGIRTPDGLGPVAEEHSFSVLSDGSFFVVYRTISGYPACSYSRDKGRTWSNPGKMQFASGRPMKHPRAANFAWKTKSGRYLYWFHNHGGPFVQKMQPIDASYPYANRNPVWLSGGVEADGPDGKIIRWSEPEIAIYDDDPFIRMSYPDLLEEKGRIFVSETQKDVARVHQLDNELLEGMWRQLEGENAPPEADTVIEGQGGLPAFTAFSVRDAESRDYRSKDLRAGFSLSFEIDLASGTGIIFDNRGISGKGVALYREEYGFRFEMSDGQFTAMAPFHADDISEDVALTVIVDGGPKIIHAVLDGVCVDGGEHRQFGWTRFGPYFTDVCSDEPAQYAGPGGRVKRLAVFQRALRVSEAIALSTSLPAVEL